MPSDLPYSLPPDPNTRRPTTGLPANACDAHFHIFGPPDRFSFAETRRYTPPCRPYENYRKMADIVGLSRGVAVQPTAHGFDNSAILDAVARSNGAMRAVVRFNEETSDAELERLHAAGARGARFSLMSDRPGSADMIAHALPRMERLGWSLVLHVEANHFIANEDFIRRIPIPTVIDHLVRVKPSAGPEQPAFALLLDLLKDDRFWTKICSINKVSDRKDAGVSDGLPFQDVIPYGQAVIERAPDRVIWGTDWPHGNIFEPGRTPNDGDLVDLIAEMAGDAVTLNKILVDNPARLYFR